MNSRLGGSTYLALLGVTALLSAGIGCSEGRKVNGSGVTTAVGGSGVTTAVGGSGVTTAVGGSSVTISAGGEGGRTQPEGGGNGGMMPAGGNGGTISGGPDSGAGGGGGAGELSLPRCDGERFRNAGGPVGAWLGIQIDGVGFDRSGSGDSVFSLDVRTVTGWQVSRVDGNLSAAGGLTDRGILAGFTPGDRIRIIATQYCQPYSGCRSSMVVRNAADGVLVTAEINDLTTVISPFGDELGVPMALEPSCAFPILDPCNEIETRQRLRVQADQQVTVEAHSQVPVTIGGHPYFVRLSLASTIVGAGPDHSGSFLCHADDLWASGGVLLSIVP